MCQAVVKGFASSHRHSKSMMLELLAHFTDEETEASGAEKHPGSRSQEVAELKFSESRAHMQRRGRRGLFRGLFRRGCRAPTGLGKTETKGFTVREESAFGAQ